MGQTRERRISSQGRLRFFRKPNPAYVAIERFDEVPAKKDITDTIKICEKYSCPIEIILKDISTVRYEPWRLTEWSRIVMQEVGA